MRFTIKFLMGNFILVQTFYSFAVSKNECLDIYNGCMRPKVLERAKVSLDWVKQHVKDSDLENISKGSAKQFEAAKEEIRSTTANTLWNFKIQEKAVKISPSENRLASPGEANLEKTIKFDDWKTKCKKDFEVCLSETIERPISKK